jgi:hypothetical protein
VREQTRRLNRVTVDGVFAIIAILRRLSASADPLTAG